MGGWKGRQGPDRFSIVYSGYAGIRRENAKMVKTVKTANMAKTMFKSRFVYCI